MFFFNTTFFKSSVKIWYFDLFYFDTTMLKNLKIEELTMIESYDKKFVEVIDTSSFSTVITHQGIKWTSIKFFISFEHFHFNTLILTFYPFKKSFFISIYIQSFYFWSTLTFQPHLHFCAHSQMQCSIHFFNDFSILYMHFFNCFVTAFQAL